jgi:hypothetical protein
MVIAKILGRTIINNTKVIIGSSDQLSYDEFSVWNFNTPTEPTNITGFSVEFDSGLVLGNFGSGDQTLQSNQAINVTI